MVKHGLSTEAFRRYVPMIQEETVNYFKRFQEDEGDFDVLQSFSELIIMTASRCLMGKEIRSQLNESVANLYHDLDGGFQPINFLFENLPLPSYKRRDEAQRKMRDLFMSIMKNRRAVDDSVGGELCVLKDCTSSFMPGKL